MKTKKSDILTCVLFCGFLGVMLLLFLLLPRQDFSEKEKRYLEDAPVLSWESFSSGRFGEDVEIYLADHIPGRDFFVGVASYYDFLSGRQAVKDVYLAQGDRVVEAPIRWDANAAQRNMKAVNHLSEVMGQNVDLMIVPSVGYFLEDTVIGMAASYEDEKIISDIYAMAGENVSTVDLIKPFLNTGDVSSLYYRTDHHWTSKGAYTAYKTYMEALGKEYPSQDAYKVTPHQGFYGTTYSRSGFWLTKGEPVEQWDTGKEYKVTCWESYGAEPQVRTELFFEEKLQELDKYTAYLGGNHFITRIDNPEAAGKGKLLVFRDSYANCLGTFLADSYETVVMVDLRYIDMRNYQEILTEIIQSEDFTDVLVSYSIGNFMTDDKLYLLSKA